MSVYQDWEPVVLRKTKKQSSQHQNPEGYKKNKQLDSNDDLPKITKYTPEQSQFLMQLRKIKNVSQEELAKMLNINVSYVKEVENMSGVQNLKLYNTMVRKLNSCKAKE